MSVNVCWPCAEGTQSVSVPLPVPDLATLYNNVGAAFGPGLSQQKFTLTDTTKDELNDEDVANLRDGATLVITFQQGGPLAAPARERISFQPHPKTLTMAGDYEYFAAQVRL
jgi:hypothetical protein